MFKVDFKARLEQLWKRKHSLQGQKLTLTTISAFFSQKGKNKTRVYHVVSLIFCEIQHCFHMWKILTHFKKSS